MVRLDLHAYVTYTSPPACKIHIIVHPSTLNQPRARRLYIDHATRRKCPARHAYLVSSWRTPPDSAPARNHRAHLPHISLCLWVQVVEEDNGPDTSTFGSRSRETKPQGLSIRRRTQLLKKHSGWVSGWLLSTRGPYQLVPTNTEVHGLPSQLATKTITGVWRPGHRQ